MKNSFQYIDLSEIYYDLKEYFELQDQFDSLLEDANMDMTKTFREYKDKYNEENKAVKDALKQKKYSEATKHANNMKNIVRQLRVQINNIPSDASESILGTCMACMISFVQLIIPTISIAAGFAVGKIPGIGPVAKIAYNAGKAKLCQSAGMSTNDVVNTINAVKDLQNDMKEYQKHNLGLEPVNAYQSKMLSYCDKLDANIDYLIKTIKATKIMNS